MTTYWLLNKQLYTANEVKQYQQDRIRIDLPPVIFTIVNVSIDRESNFAVGWEGLTESGNKAVITEVFDNKFFGRVHTLYGWYAHGWDLNGKSLYTDNSNLVCKGI